MNENNLISRIVPLGLYNFYIEIALAMLILLAFAKKRRYFPLRVALFLAIGFPFYYLPHISLFSFNYSYIIVLASCSILSLFLYDEKVFPIILSAIAAWGLQHIAWNITGIVYDLIPNVASYSNTFLLTILYIAFITFYSIVFLIIYRLKIKILFDRRQLFSFIFAAIIIVTTMYLSQLIKSWNITIRVYTMLVSFLSLIIMFGYPYLSALLIKEKELSGEKEMLEKMLEVQANQQRLSKESTDILNMKFHDMKHQLMLMKSMDDNERNKTSEEIEKSIDIYTNIARTNNESMDIVITQKSLLCSSNDIRFTYILSGECLSFMNKTDITSLYGNILDNAIEATKDEKGEYRIIKLKTYLQNGLVLIQEENYCHKKIIFNKDGLPQSDKRDVTNHGFGIKSIRYIVEKYHGEMNIRHENDVYYLSIAIPYINK